jgi:predicted N-acetyltransferase YhbS
MGPALSHIEPLGPEPGLATWLAQRHHAEWRSLMPGWTLSSAVTELVDHVGRERPPMTLVAFDGPTPVGSVSLVELDAPEFDDLSPWLASLWVRPASRRRGIGGALVDAAVGRAARCGWTRLHLFTPDHADWYAARGWRRVERRHLGVTAVDVLAIDAVSRQGRAA